MRRLCAIALSLAMAGCAVQPPTPAPDAQRFVVFFQVWSAALDEPAVAAIKAAAAEAAAKHDEHVIVVGYADQVGSSAANDFLSRTRAQVVADELVTDGVARGRITIDARGSTPSALSSQASRRVEIITTR
ncbi:MAG TPA: OmpA family protein [Acetobacteraceae bacterium]|jgi:outer membrane protein OmpA-like peptidoglycan-associated protein|nr:OmpA family protein [Acetobacteraceae bacterium]